jgi:hypothetical protein
MTVRDDVTGIVELPHQLAELLRRLGARHPCVVARPPMKIFGNSGPALCIHLASRECPIERSAELAARLIPLRRAFLWSCKGAVDQNDGIGHRSPVGDE